MDSSGTERFCDKSAEIGRNETSDDNDGQLVSKERIFRFETEIKRNRLNALGLRTLDDLTDQAAWEALYARWKATMWGHPLPGKSDLLKALTPLPMSQKMTLIGFLHLAEAGQTDDLTASQFRLQKDRAKACGLSPGVPVRLLGAPTIVLDLHSGTHRPMTDEERSISLTAG